MGSTIIVVQKSTEIYTQVAINHAQKIVSPIDFINLG